MKLEWKWENGAFNSSQNVARLGKWKVGAVHYDASTSRDEPKKYRANPLLSGLKQTLGLFQTEKEAKTKIEEAVKYWVKEAGLLSEG